MGKRKIAKLFGIRFCYCGKCVWWSKETLRYIEDPDDIIGFTAPACFSCLAYAEKNGCL